MGFTLTRLLLLSVTSQLKKDENNTTHNEVQRRVKYLKISIPYEPRRDKTCLQGFRQKETQTSVLGYGEKLEH